MKKWRLVILFLMLALWSIGEASAQCSICTKTALQQGEKPAKGLNSGIVYLMLAPFAVIGYIGVRWWKSERN